MNALGLEYASSSEDEGGANAPSSASSLRQADAQDTQLSAAVSATSGDSVSTSSEVTEDAAEIEDLEAALARAGVPPAPVAPANPAVQERITSILSAQRERGEDFQTGLQARKEVRNPYILDKVVAYFGIDELFSNFDARVFDPHALPLHEFSDALALEHRRREEARVRRQQQTQLQLHQATAAGSDAGRWIHFSSSARST